MSKQSLEPTSFSSIGVCIFPVPAANSPRTVSYPHYLHEVLAHAGLYYHNIEFSQLAQALPHLKVLLTVGDAEMSAPAQRELREWVQAGGAWLSIGGVAGLPELFGVACRASDPDSKLWGGRRRTLGEGYLKSANAKHPILSGIPSLHFFNGVAVEPVIDANDDDDTQPIQVLADCLDAHGRLSEHPAIVERKIGQGHCLLIAPDVTGSIVRIQQGVAVTRDGLSAPDGTANVTDGLLKCDDGAVLDWHFDRCEAPGVPGLQYFAEPVADHWRSLVLRAIFYLAQKTRTLLILLWLYPRNLPAIAHISHDSDENDPELAGELLKATAQAQVSTTWCIILPGYDVEMIARIRKGGHELATHYDALERPWNKAEFAAQFRELSRRFGEQPITNKNHYTRWEGDTEFFEWCFCNGIQLDQSKGPSKSGEAGFLFGCCHPYFPVAPSGAVIDVLELPFQSQDLEVFVPFALVPALVRAVTSVHGVLHILFHPHHIGKNGVAQSLIDATTTARIAGIEWWTARRINDWERARRKVQWQNGAQSTLIKISSPQPLNDATFLVMNTPSPSIRVNGQEQSLSETTRWNFDFLAMTFSLEAGAEYLLQIGGTPEAS